MFLTAKFYLMKFLKKAPFTLYILFFITLSCGPKPSQTEVAVELEDTSIPPGTIKLTDNLYIDRVPVTNLMYAEFLDHLGNYWSEKKHEKMKSYASYGLEADSVFQPYTGSTRLMMGATLDPKHMVTSNLTLGNYTSHPYYQWHPVVNISQEKAELFCKWRTDMVNAVYGIRSRNESQRSQYPTQVYYRLPTEKEMIAAQNLLDKKLKLLTYQDEIYSYGGDFYKFRRIQDEYHMAIFEMKELSKNGPYLPVYKSLSYYESNQLQTGFRCICEVTP
ncbi:SUMF1/EgtB/PvdO family nonheme iron enzyme [Nonlabens mediterrranea]|uniref:SUMF1/EgtB/PvdO family nonheme iron enzyme n=1 Tax=Nonlabens mediterrranea TaxID=1419947 RepID=A0ABS0A1R6_9FLAO|nr:SUMF1/EgtB/PvdO family nonheme iron enzyme [Nonlabens mediterrranea]